ncbi:MAG: AraC family transcriptional regulator [Verrucomicrobiota bacterium]|nr:AraC family transcriptional regulator [Verrucomicrobiota bacterium]
MTKRSATRVNIANDRLEAKPFEAWGPRTIPDTELVFVHTGLFSLKTEKETLRIGKNGLLSIPPRTRHVFQSLEESGTISCIHCDISERAPSIQSLHCSDPEIPEAFRRCAEAFIHPAPHRNELLGAILGELLIRLRATGSLRESNPPSERVQTMAAYIREHSHEPVSRSVLAATFHISPQHINHLFKTELGTSPTALLHLERSKQAFLLIQNERIGIAEAAERTGFCDAYHFSKVFKKVYGFPPGRIRRFFQPQTNR